MKENRLIFFSPFHEGFVGKIGQQANEIAQEKGKNLYTQEKEKIDSNPNSQEKDEILQAYEAAEQKAKAETEKVEAELKQSVNKVEGSALKTEKRITDSPVSSKYKEELIKEFKDLIDTSAEEYTQIPKDGDEAFKAVSENTKVVLDAFDQDPEVKRIYEVIEPLYANRDAIANAINLTSYESGSGFWKEIQGALNGIVSPDQLNEFQKEMGLTVDGGKPGPETINALAELLNIPLKEVKFSNETKFGEDIELNDSLQEKADHESGVLGVEYMESMVAKAHENSEGFWRGQKVLNLLPRIFGGRGYDDVKMELAESAYKNLQYLKKGQDSFDSLVKTHGAQKIAAAIEDDNLHSLAASSLVSPQDLARISMYLQSPEGALRQKEIRQEEITNEDRAKAALERAKQIEASTDFATAKPIYTSIAEQFQGTQAAREAMEKSAGFWEASADIYNEYVGDAALAVAPVGGLAVEAGGKVLLSASAKTAAKTIAAKTAAKKAGSEVVEGAAKAAAKEAAESAAKSGASKRAAAKAGESAASAAKAEAVESLAKEAGEKAAEKALKSRAAQKSARQVAKVTAEKARQKVVKGALKGGASKTAAKKAGVEAAKTAKSAAYTEALEAGAKEASKAAVKETTEALTASVSKNWAGEAISLGYKITDTKAVKAIDTLLLKHPKINNKLGSLAVSLGLDTARILGASAVAEEIHPGAGHYVLLGFVGAQSVRAGISTALGRSEIENRIRLELTKNGTSKTATNKIISELRKTVLKAPPKQAKVSQSMSRFADARRSIARFEMRQFQKITPQLAQEAAEAAGVQLSHIDRQLARGLKSKSPIKAETLNGYFNDISKIQRSAGKILASKVSNSVKNIFRSILERCANLKNGIKSLLVKLKPKPKVRQQLSPAREEIVAARVERKASEPKMKVVPKDAELQQQLGVLEENLKVAKDRLKQANKKAKGKGGKRGSNSVKDHRRNVERLEKQKEELEARIAKQSEQVKAEPIQGTVAKEKAKTPKKIEVNKIMATGRSFEKGTTVWFKENGQLVEGKVIGNSSTKPGQIMVELTGPKGKTLKPASPADLSKWQTEAQFNVVKLPEKEAVQEFGKVAGVAAKGKPTRAEKKWIGRVMDKNRSVNVPRSDGRITRAKVSVYDPQTGFMTVEVGGGPTAGRKTMHISEISGLNIGLSKKTEGKWLKKVIKKKDKVNVVRSDGTVSPGVIVEHNFDQGSVRVVYKGKGVDPIRQDIAITQLYKDNMLLSHSSPEQWAEIMMKNGLKVNIPRTDGSISVGKITSKNGNYIKVEFPIGEEIGEKMFTLTELYKANPVVMTLSK